MYKDHNIIPNLGSRDSEISKLGSSAAVQEYVLWLFEGFEGFEAHNGEAHTVGG